MKVWYTSLRFLAAMTLLTGVAYPLAMTGIGQMLFSQRVTGSFLVHDGVVVGSELIAQQFKDPKYFWARPSGVDFNPMPSGGTNMGPTSQDLKANVQDRRNQGLTRELLFSSGSGLDPHISPEAAMDQVSRVAAARNVPEATISDIVRRNIEPRQFAVLGQPRVNVLKLNIDLERR
ncbi:MAG: potassium-transporting ATPase subunit KdpC [Bdellovibrionales bacterium]